MRSEWDDDPVTSFIPDYLAQTGLSIPPYVIPVAVGIVVLGIILMVISLVQRRRNKSTDV